MVVGAGFAGAVVAERIAEVLNEEVLIIEKRNHIGGNAYDYYNEEGVLVHKYGPHIFHTKSETVWNYLSTFTEWNHYNHRVLGKVDGQDIPIPFNLNSLFKVFPERLAKKIESKLIQYYGFGVKVPILKLMEHEDTDLRVLASYIYDKVFVNYTTKQWGLMPNELDSSVTGRVPVYISKDNRYFQDKFQGIPKNGYSKLFENLLSNKKIKILLNTDFGEVLKFDKKYGIIELFGNKFDGTVIYSGKIDELWNYEYGELPYRSLNFNFETLDTERYQEVGTVNYPNDYSFTRITEFKHLTNQSHPKTCIVREYPQKYDKDSETNNIPYYPIQVYENKELYKKYKENARSFSKLYLIGRLAEYMYYDMDAVVLRALKLFEEKIKQ